MKNHDSRKTSYIQNRIHLISLEIYIKDTKVWTRFNLTTGNHL